ncbi:MAG: succinylglutamate desuccinylase/aspartoacylase family protein [Bacillota bacterium]
MSKFKVGNLEVDQGDFGYGSLGSVELPDGTEVNVPLIVINGKKEGPVFTVVAGVHGTEISAVGSLLTAVKKMDPKNIRGTFIGIPGGNPFAVMTGTYTSFVDGKNLSNYWFFKAKSNGSITERIAYHIDKALTKSDLIVDLHANPFPSMHFVMVDIETYANEETRKKTYKMAKAYGVTTIEMPVDKPSTMRACATEQGVPALTAEVIGNEYLFDEINEVGSNGILNIMREFEMMSGEVVKQPVEKMEGKYRFHSNLRCNRGGLMWIKHEPGELIKKGETAIEITNLYGKVIEEVKMPVDGYCWSYTGGINGTHAVPEGNDLAYVFYKMDE